MADKLRIHQLAKDLGVNSKAILEKCRAEGLDVKNHMSTVSAGLAATIREWFSESGATTATETAERVDLKRVRKKSRTRRATTASAPPTTDVDAAAVAVVEPDAVEPTIVEEAPAETVVADAGDTATIESEAPVVEPKAEPTTPEPPVEPPTESVDATEEPDAEAPDQDPVQPVGPQNVPTPARLAGPRVIRVEAPEKLRPLRSHDRQSTPPPTSSGAATPEQDASQTRRKTRSKTYQGESEEERRKKQTRRRIVRGSEAGEQLREWRDRDLAERQERIRGATGRRAKRRASESQGPVEHREITSAQVTEPIIMKNFCAATGLSLVQLTPKLMNDFKILPNINMVLERETAELLATEFGIDLVVVAAKSPINDVREEFKARERKHLEPRAPVVAFLGHVDHGKTSLLDAIRNSSVTSGEAGGITQHMGSYHYEKDGLSVTFMDTPGHEAFTAMRARGAQMTDVVVLVVAADDGVMPQTIEAINHAKAAEVTIVIALNKIDIPGVDVNKVYGQLSEHELTPTEWGGTYDVIKTSATAGTGVSELIEHLSTLSELLELEADSTLPACGRVIEAQMKEGSGVVARVLVQDGTLNAGDVMVCGQGFGRVRSIKDCQGHKLQKPAGPSMPVEISGLDELPSAGDEFFVVDSLKRAEQIATEARQRLRSDSLTTFNKPKTLEDLFGQRQAGEIPELNIIIKADAQGSVDVLNHTLQEIPSDEVKLNVLHSGVGGIVDSDVLLADASSAIVIGFQVVADSRVKRLADEHGVDVRLYRVIYNVIDDIKKALEGLLEPDEKIESRGQAEVRDIFRISKVGTIAGCYVREGSVARQHHVRVIRDSVIIRDDSLIQSLKRFKDDAKEVKGGYECGIKIDGFDDLKPGDIIESYEIVKVARTL